MHSAFDVFRHTNVGGSGNVEKVKNETPPGVSEDFAVDVEALLEGVGTPPMTLSGLPTGSDRAPTLLGLAHGAGRRCGRTR